MSGKVIAFVAPTRSGKTFLTKKLAEHFASPALYETDVPIPERIRYSHADTVNQWERHLYFRGRSIDMMLEGRGLAAKHAYVFLDAAWVSCSPYIDVYNIGDFERSLLNQLSALDMKTLPWPDALIVLKEDDSTSEKLLRHGHEQFDENYFNNQLLIIKHSFEKFVTATAFPVPTVHIDRSGIDYDDPDAFARLLESLKPIL